MDNGEVLNRVEALSNRIDAAMKAMTKSDFGSSLLNAEQTDRFVRTVEIATPILQEARRIPMNESDKRDINRVAFQNRVFHDPNESQSAKTEEASTFTNQLNAVETMGIVGIEDDALEDNIEEDDFEDTLMDLIGEQAGVDFEELYLQGDTAGTGDPYLQLTDGWLKLAANQVTSSNYDETDPEAALQAAYDAVPYKYTSSRNSNRGDWRFYCDPLIEDNYRDVLRARGTGLGDEAQTSNNALRYKGYPVVDVGNMPSGELLFTNPDNLAYGVRRQVRIEEDRMPKERQTDFVITARVDAHYEDENGASRVQGYTG